MRTDDIGMFSLMASLFGVIAATIAAYITHLFWIMSLLMGDASVPTGKVIIAIVGLLVPPFGIIHGVWLWFH